MRPLPCCSPNGNPLPDPGDNGFTLVEVIAALVILGILGAFMTLGVTRIMEGYVAVRSNADIALKGQVAMARIMKELRSLDAVSAGGQTSVIYSYNVNGSQVTGRTLSWNGINGSALLLGGNTLTDNVNDLTLTYHTSFSDAGDNTWNGGETLIGISLSLNGGQNTVSTFTGRVRPRNL